MLVRDHLAQSLRLCPWCQQRPTLDQDCDLTWHVACLNKQCPVVPITRGYSSPMAVMMVWNGYGQVADITPLAVS